MDHSLEFIHFVSHRYDNEGHALEGQSLTELKSGGGGGNTNWKTLWDVKTEHLGHGEKVHAFPVAAFDARPTSEMC